MTIEIHQPELERIIQQRLSSGRYRDVEDVLRDALMPHEAETAPAPRKESLLEMFARARGLGDGLDISRDPSPGREIDLS